MSDVVVIPDDPAPDPATAPVIVTVVTSDSDDSVAEDAQETADAAVEVSFATADALLALSDRVAALETAPPAEIAIVEETAPAPEPVTEEPAPPGESTGGDNPVDTPPKKKAKTPLKDSGWFKGRK